MTIGKSQKSVIKNSEIEMSTGLIRQRRNLLLAGVLLFIFVYAEAHISKSFNILGITIDADNTSKLEILPLLICTYFLFRFWQYLSQEEKPSLRSIYVAFFQRSSQSKIQKISYDAIAKMEEIATAEDFSASPVTIMPFPYHQKWYQRKRIEEKSLKDDYIKLPFYKRLINVAYSPKKYMDDNAPESYTVDSSKQKYAHVEVNVLQFWWNHISAIYRSLFSTSYFTDYYLPPLVGLISIIYFLWIKWM